jgi:putative ABC transport system permease protein
MNLMSGVAQDARYALRQLHKNPGFATVAVITLGLGIGANTTMFSVIRAVLLRPLAMQDPSRVMVGVVGDVRLRGLDVDVQPTFHLPLAQMPPGAWDWLGRTMDLVVRTRGGVFPANDLRTIVATIAPGVPIYQLSTMQEKMAGALEASHFDTFLLSLFAGIALVLSSVGIYGVLSHVFSQRTRDIGLRMALGATRGQIAGHVLGSGLRLIVPGIALGVVGALAGARLVS